MAILLSVKTHGKKYENHIVDSKIGQFVILRHVYRYVTVRNVHLYLIGNLSSSPGQKSAKFPGGENPGDIHTSVAAKKALGKGRFITRLFYCVSVMIHYD